MSAVTSVIGAAGDSAGPAPTQYNTWQPSNTTGQDTNFNNAISNNFQTAQNTAPAWQQYLSQVQNNPYSAGAQTSANNAGNLYTQAGQAATGAANNLNGASGAVLNTAFDPQSQLYNTQNQNNTDMTNASLAARGLNSSGVGADLAQQSNNNFNMNWLNNQLGRQTTGLASAASGYGQGNTLANAGANSVGYGGQVPLTAYNQNLSNTAGGLNTYGQGNTAIQNQVLPQILQYLGLGASQSNQQGNFDEQYWNNQQQYQSDQNSLNNQLWSSIGGLGDAGIGAFAGSGAFSSGGFFNPATADYANPASLSQTTPQGVYDSLPDTASY